MCNAENLPDAVGNVKSRISQDLFQLNRSDYFPYKDIEHKFAVYKTVDMLWGLALKTAFEDVPESEIGPAILDTGCTTTCSPFLDDFIGEMEYGDFGCIHTADKDVVHHIKARGLIQLYVVDSLG